MHDINPVINSACGGFRKIIDKFMYYLPGKTNGFETS